MNQQVETKMGEATIVVSSLTIKAQIIQDNLLRRHDVIMAGVTQKYGIAEDDQRVLVGSFNFCVISARAKVVAGNLSFSLLSPFDSDKQLIKKTLDFFEVYTSDYDEIVNLINRIDSPDDEALAPGATDQYKDMELDEIEALPESEKKS